MLRFALRRLAIAVPMVILASFVMYLMVTLSGDPLARFRDTDPPPPPETIKLLEKQFGLDQPFLVRYVNWITGLFRGDFGVSTQNIDIGAELGNRMMVSFRLILAAIVIAAIVAIVIGVVSALRQYGFLDTTLSVVTYIALAVPVFWFAILLKQAAISFNQMVGSTVLYTIGDGVSTGVTGFALLGFLVLPTIALVINIFASWSRYVRASMIEVLSADYMRLARAKGLSRAQAVMRHGLRNALLRSRRRSRRHRGGLPVARHGRPAAQRGAQHRRQRGRGVAARLRGRDHPHEPDRRPPLRTARPADPPALSQER
jgi:peptide/nickel transport system permease protein